MPGALARGRMAQRVQDAPPWLWVGFSPPHLAMEAHSCSPGSVTTHELLPRTTYHPPKAGLPRTDASSRVAALDRALSQCYDPTPSER